jgi:RNA polymerase sigma-70 factor (TIGR02943 family)
MPRDNRLEQWVEDYTKEMYSWALHKVSDTELAKDLVQDTFLAAVEKIQSFKGDSSPKTWLFSILNHKIIDHYRKKINLPASIENKSLLSFFDADRGWNPEKRPKEWDEDESELLDNEELIIVLNNCLGELPEIWNASIKLKFLFKKKGEEICQELNISPTNLWQIMHRAKIQLRERVENNWFKK